MSVITKITIQKKNKDRYNIFLDSGKGEEYAFSVDEDVLIKHQLKKGLEIDDLSITEVLFQDDIRKSYNFAIHYLSHRMRSEREVNQYLAKKEVSEQVINEVIYKLKNHGYLNDEEFAKAFVRTQQNTTDKGLNVIKQEMKEKGISEAILTDTLKEYPENLQFEKALKLCEKYIEKNKKESSRNLKQKLEQMLLRKGYPFSVIKLALDEAEIEKSDSDELEALRIQADKLHKKYAKFSGYEYKQKMKQALFRKGFPIDLIDECLQERELE